MSNNPSVGLNPLFCSRVVKPLVLLLNSSVVGIYPYFLAIL